MMMQSSRLLYGRPGVELLPAYETASSKRDFRPKSGADIVTLILLYVIAT